MSEIDNMMRRSRAIEALSWGMPIVSYHRMLTAAIDCGMSGENQIIFWSDRFDWRNQELTTNPDTIYIHSFMNTRDAGPVVIEIPAATPENSINGAVMSCWQDALQDVGLQGWDAGRGGKYLVLPPNYAGVIPVGYTAIWSNTYHTYAIFRSVLKSQGPEDVQAAVDYGKRVKVYPLSQVENPPQNPWTDLIDSFYDVTIPYDHTFYRHLNDALQDEIPLERDRAMIDILAAIGIVRGMPFDPSAADVSMLDAAASDAYTWIDEKYAAIFGGEPYFAETHWVFPTHLSGLIQDISDRYRSVASYPIDQRGVTFCFLWFAARRINAGQFYVVSIADCDGNPLDGSRTYSMNIPADAPASQFWSATVYDRRTHSMIPKTSRQSVSSQNVDLQVNADGSTDVYFGPTAPVGKESNWVPTDPAGTWETMFRFFGPQPTLFDGSWSMSDIRPLDG